MIAPEPMIRIENLLVRFGAYRAVDGLTLNLNKGELFGLLGPNGAGKSTTVRVLIGQRRPDGGQAFVCNYDVVRQWHLVKPLFGYVPDRDNHFDEFTGRRNLSIFADLYAVSRHRVDECLGIVELQEAADVPVRGYSLGMKKKLLLARALLHDPPVLYLDEPTANLDIHSCAIVHRILRERVKAGRTVLLTTHNMTEVEAICDRVAIMAKGKLIALDSPLTLRSKHTERKVDVNLSDGSRLVFNLDRDDDRSRLAELTRSGQVGSMHTREFDFHSTFLKLTGTVFD
jgi:ABC-2 type transport system ATP-binding protein